MRAKAPVQTIAPYDEAIVKDCKLPTVSTRPVNSVVQTISEYEVSSSPALPALRFNGYVIVSADGMLADASGVMPTILNFPATSPFSPQLSTVPT